MPPKKKSNKKGGEDWEAELGETPDPIAAATQAAKDEDPAPDAPADGDADEDGGGGGLLAALRKNRTKKAKKGKPVQEDFVEGEDPPGATNGTTPATDGKAAEEADADDVFGAAPAKGKGGKGKQAQAKVEPAADGDEDGEGGLKSKKEKEREKKEREKQRKKEQVSVPSLS